MKIRNLHNFNLGLGLAAIIGISSTFTSCSRQMAVIHNTSKLQYQQALNQASPASDVQKTTKPKLVALPEIIAPVSLTENKPAFKQTVTPATKSVMGHRTNHLFATSKIVKQEILKTDRK